ncbi:Type II secretory pathway, component PulK [Desulfonatronum thiosulfatophilum]|uniref:Type II secretory pathway, component PulK n=1 Tax=Desulfonatronum thiosulfatophilum TaxID=617002 RepID=A0A1G6EE12_9BACT|nr:type II secretion system protein GspK [Desulfonatronum thiosulfatophilum]SDB55622.1 Type II secretory pathway, component PulK [Desulfonatronum thiosulfatophilum]
MTPRSKNDDPRAMQPRGAILVLVLVTLILFSTLVLQVSQRAVHVVEDHTFLVQALQAELQAEAALAKALEMLGQSNAASSSDGGRPESWTWQEDGIRIIVMPANAKLNLNALHPPSLPPQGMQRLHAALPRILQDEALEAEVQDILLWLGLGYDPNKPGSERRADRPYAEVQPNYRPRKGAMQRPEELLLVRGFAGLDPDWVRERFTVWGRDGRVNLNFAASDVLLALAPELEAYWPAIDRYRTEQGFRSTDELMMQIRLPMDLYQRVLPHIALESDIFEISVEVRLPAWYEMHRVIVEHSAILAETPPRILAKDILESRPLDIIPRRGVQTGAM